MDAPEQFVRGVADRRPEPVDPYRRPPLQRHQKRRLGDLGGADVEANGGLKAAVQGDRSEHGRQIGTGQPAEVERIQAAVGKLEAQRLQPGIGGMDPSDQVQHALKVGKSFDGMLQRSGHGGGGALSAGCLPVTRAA